MKSNREYTDYLQDILEAATKARQFVKDVDFEAFRTDDEKGYKETAPGYTISYEYANELKL